MMLFLANISFFYDILFEIMKFMLIFGIPILLLIVGFVFLIKIFFLPAFASGRKKQEQTVVALVLGKREEFLHNATGLYSLYYVTFTFGENERLELKVNKSEYNDLSYMDKVELTHKGELLISYYILEKSKEEYKGEEKHVASMMRSSLNEIAQKKREK